MSSRFPFMTSGIDIFSLDLPGAVKNRECALEVTWACFGQRKAPL